MNIDIFHDIFLTGENRKDPLCGMEMLHSPKFENRILLYHIISWIKGMNMFATRDCTLKSLNSCNSMQVKVS